MKKLLNKRFLIGIFLLIFCTSSSIAEQLCKDFIKPTTPAERFIDNEDGTIIDTKTGLMWKKCSEGQSGVFCTEGAAMKYSWQQALKQAETTNSGGGYAGYPDWRVPNIKELLSIVERQCMRPAINLSVFPNYELYNNYWSSSPFANNGGIAWIVNFDLGYDTSYYKSNSSYVRLVRGGQ